MTLAIIDVQGSSVTVARILPTPGSNNVEIVMTGQDVSFAQDLLADQMAGSIYIGRFREAGSGTVPVIDKATGEVLFTSGVASPEDVADACRAAKQAQEQWAQRPESH